MSFLARTVTVADGVQTLFPVSFPLPPISGRSGVEVYVHAQGALDPGTPQVEGVDFTWVSDGQISFTAAPTAGNEVDARRATTINELDNTIQAGGSLRSTELVQNDTQLLYLLQEREDEAANLLTLLEAEAATRASALADETANRVAADNNEGTARATEDSVLQGNINDAVGRSVRTPVGDALAELPDAATRSSKFPQFSVLGTALSLLSSTQLAQVLLDPIRTLLGAAFKGDPGGNAAAIGLFTTAATHLGGAGVVIPAGYDLVKTSGYRSTGYGQAEYAKDAAVDAAYVLAHPTTSFISNTGAGYRLASTTGGPRMFGAFGGAPSPNLAKIGVDDTAAVAALFAYYAAHPEFTPDGGGLYYSTSQTVLIKQRSASDVGENQNPGSVINPWIVAATGSTGGSLIQVWANQSHIRGKIRAFGTGGLSYAGRGWTSGIEICDSNDLTIDSWQAANFKRNGFLTSLYQPDGVTLGNNIGLQVGNGHADYCGSTVDVGNAATLRYTITSIAFNGAANATGQTTRIGITPALDAAIQVGDPIGYTDPVTGKRSAHIISAIVDPNTVDLQYWMSPNAAVGHGIISLHGSATKVIGGNTAWASFGRIDGDYCGSIIYDGGTYGANFGRAGAEVVGIAIIKGNWSSGATQLGGSVEGYHAEGVHLDILLLGSSLQGGYIGPSTAQSVATAVADRDTLGMIYSCSPRSNPDANGKYDRPFGTFKSCVIWTYNGPLIPESGPQPSVTAVSLGTTITLDNRRIGRRYRWADARATPNLTFLLDWYENIYQSNKGYNWIEFDVLAKGDATHPLGPQSIAVGLPAALVTAGYTLNGGTANILYGTTQGHVRGVAVMDWINKNWQLSVKADAPVVQKVTATQAVITPDTTQDEVHISGQGAAFTIANPTTLSHPTTAIPAGKKLVLRLKDNGTSRAITWGSQYRGIVAALPAATTAGKLTYAIFKWHATDGTWDLVTLITQA